MKKFLSCNTFKFKTEQTLIAICVFFLFLQPTSTAKNISGAGCLIKLDESLVMVKDAWSGKYSIPGGGLKIGEEVKHGAIRETLEETGIKVEIDADLPQYNDFHIFVCSITEDVNILKSSKKQGKYIVGNIPLRVMSRNEIESVSLIDPYLLPITMWRFPLNRESILRMFDKAPSGHNVVLIENRQKEINSLFRWEIEFITLIQSYNQPFLLILNRVFSLFAEKYVFMIIISFFVLSGRWKLGIFLMFSIFGSSLISGILKDLFELERPFEAIPELQLANASSFGFPSGHTMAATVFWGLLYFIRRSKASLVLFIAIITMVSFSRIYLGVHYPHDVIGSWFFGSLMVLVLSQYIKKNLIDNMFNSLPKIWIYGTIFTIVGLTLHYTPSTLFMGITWFSAMIGLQFGKEQRQIYSIPTNWKAKIFRAAAGAVGLTIIILVSNYLLPDKKTSFFVTLKIGVSSMFAGLWISWGCFVLINYLKWAGKIGENK